MDEVLKTKLLHGVMDAESCTEVHRSRIELKSRGDARDISHVIASRRVEREKMDRCASGVHPRLKEAASSTDVSECGGKGREGFSKGGVEGSSKGKGKARLGRVHRLGKEELDKE